MKSNKWMIPLVAVSALVISGCSQMQQNSEEAVAGNRITTGSAAGTGSALNLTGVNGRGSSSRGV